MTKSSSGQLALVQRVSVSRRPQRRRHAAVALVVAMAAALLAVAPASATPSRGGSTGTTQYIAPIGNGSATYHRTDEVTFSPGQIEPGEPFHLLVRHADLLISHDEGNCLPYQIEHQVLTQNSWHLARVDPGENIYAMNGDGYGVSGIGTYTRHQELTCDPATTVGNWTTDLSVSAEGTAHLVPGCYQTSGVNPHLVVADEVTGAIATLIVGDVSCTDEAVTINKTVNGGAIPTGSAFNFQLREGASTASGGSLLETGAATATNGGAIEFLTEVNPGSYQICEDIAPGWSGTVASHADRFIPASAGVPAETVDNAIVCIPINVLPGGTVVLDLDNVPPPGGMAKTIGFWKNHADCKASKGNQLNVLGATLAKASIAAGQSTRGFYVGTLYVDTCAEAVALLNKSTLTGKKSSSDPTYNFAAQFVAYSLNHVAGGFMSSAANTAAARGQEVLVKYVFSGTGAYARTLTKADAGTVNAGAVVLDRYNNNEAG